MSRARRFRLSATGGRSYYVDATNGDDDNAGTGELTAWQSLTPVNAAALEAGDRVLFKRGETFSGQLTPAVSGAPGNFITFGAYGSGDRPIIDGVAARALVVTADYAYLRFESLHFYRSSGTNECATGWSHDLYFYDCETSASGGLGSTSWSSDGTGIYNVTYDACLFHNNARSGLYIGSTTAPGPVNCLVTRCSSYNNGNETSGVGNGFYIKYGTTLEYSTAYDNIYEGGLKTNSESSPAVANTPTVRYCTSYGNRNGIICGSNLSKIYNNLVYANLRGSLSLETAASDTDGSEIYFNTFVNAQTYWCIGLAYDIGGLTFKNNIFIQDAAVEAHYLINTATGLSLETFADKNTFDNNVYYYNGNTAAHAVCDSGTGRDWADWVGFDSAPDANSTYLPALPGFVTRYTNLHPAAGGNLEGTGAAIVGYTTDKDGLTRASPPTPGCYEVAA